MSVLGTTTSQWLSPAENSLLVRSSRNKVAIMSYKWTTALNSLQSYLSEQGYTPVFISLQQNVGVLNFEGAGFTVQGTTHSFSDFVCCYGGITNNDSWSKNYLETLLKIFAGHGVTSLDSFKGVQMTNYKQIMMRLFKREGIPTPDFFICNGYTPAWCLERILDQFSDKVAIKHNGSRGRNVQIRSLDKLGVLAETLNQHRAPNSQFINKKLVIQQYISSKDKNNYTHHYRILVINGKILASIKYTAADTKLLKSTYIHGSPSKCLQAIDPDKILSEENKEMVIRACKAMGIRLAGVDVIFTKDKMYILEVNNAPGDIYPEIFGHNRLLEETVNYIRTL